MCLLKCSRIRITVCSTFLFITFKPYAWLSLRVFPEECLATSVHDEVATQYEVAAKYKADKVASCQV